MQASKTETVTLSEPIQALGGETKKYVDIRTKVLVGDWRWSNKQAASAEDRMVYMVCRMAGLDMKEVEQLCMADFHKLTEAIDLGAEDPKA